MKSYYIVIVLLVALGLVWVMNCFNIVPKSFFVYASTIISITGIMVSWVEFLKYTIRRRKYVYVSFSFRNIQTAEQLANNIKGLPVKIGTTDIKGGELTDLAVSKLIKNSMICFVLLGEKVSVAQKYEIKEMLRMEKRIIPILINPSSEIPYNLRNINPVLYTDFMKSEYRPLE